MASDPTRSSISRDSARSLALAVLVRAIDSKEGADSLLDLAFSRSQLDGRDKALTLELTYGVLRRLATLDWRLGPLLDKPLLKLPSMVQMIIRLGAYQLLFLDRIPPSAAVNESVNLAKEQARRLKRDWSGLVNAVLRRLIRESASAWPPIGLDPGKYLAVRHSVPEWLSRRWIDRFGLSLAEKLCAQTSSVPPVTLRVHRLRNSRDELLAKLRHAGIAAEPTTISPLGILVEGGGMVATLPGFREGAFYVEDEAAQLIPLLVAARPGFVVLDACAAPGGKSIHLADVMQNRGVVYSMDRSGERLALLRDNCERLGATIVNPIRGDARSIGTLPAIPETVDAILVDAPCSGLGVLRRHPEAKWRKDAADLPRHHDVQLEILNAVAPRLRPGGSLVYSTCSGEPEETTEVIEQFLSSHAGFRREPVLQYLPKSAQQFVTVLGDLFTVGNDLSMDGFYAARLRKQ